MIVSASLHVITIFSHAVVKTSFIHSTQITKLASIPFRFKAGGEGKMPSAVGHSHRPTTKISSKSFKSRKSTKGALRDAAKGNVAHSLFMTDFAEYGA